MFTDKQLRGLAELKDILPKLNAENASEDCCRLPILKRNEDGSFPFPHVEYKTWVHRMINAMYACDLMAQDYREQLESFGISAPVSPEEISGFSKEATLAYMTWIIRSERFCDGSIQNAIADGSLKHSIERLILLSQT